MENHPAANEFPMMDDKRFKDLLDDIKANGLRVPITLHDGKVLDGRNRQKACDELGIQPDYDMYEGDPYAYVWSLNGNRRDLVKEQRYLIWKECSEKSEAWQAEQKRIRDEANRKRSEAASDGRVGRAAANNTPEQRYIAWEEKQDGGGDEFSASTECGQSKVSPRGQGSTAKAKASNTNRGAVERGDTLAKKRPDLAEKVRLGEMKPAAAHRQMKQDEVAENVSALPTDEYTVIYADPPWKYNDAQAVKGDYGTGTGAANSHYPSMTLSELKSLDVESLAADNCVLFLWATSPLLPDSLELVKAWGFKYKSSFVWDKVKHNMGHYNSVRHEFLLVCTKGSCTPQVSKLFDSVQSIERGQHSEKPSEFREIIETLYPHGRRIELFCRGEAPDGWDAWGNEANA